VLRLHPKGGSCFHKGTDYAGVTLSTSIVLTLFFYLLEETQCRKSSQHIQMDYFYAVLFTDTASCWKMNTVNIYWSLCMYDSQSLLGRLSSLSLLLHRLNEISYNSNEHKLIIKTGMCMCMHLWICSAHFQ